MKFYHNTKKSNLESILKNGLLIKYDEYKHGRMHLSPKPFAFTYPQENEVILEIEIKNVRELTCFEKNEEWEVFCHRDIEPKDIQVFHRGMY